MSKEPCACVNHAIPVERKPDGTQPGDDRLMMLSPQHWPHWPVLPLKKRGGPELTVGILYDADGDHGAEGMPRLRFLSGALLGITPFAAIMSAPGADIDAIIADGWVVD